MRCGTRCIAVIGFTLLACLGEAQQVRIEGAFPRQLPRGQATVMHVAVPSRDAIQAAEISPAAGVKVGGIQRGDNFQGALTWSDLRIEVAEDAAPGDRTMVLVLPMGRTIPITITIPNHVPAISDLRVLPAQSNPPALELQFTAADTAADLGDSPYVWFMIGCDSELLPGIVHGKLTVREKGSGVVRAGIPTPAKGSCDLQVRVTDSGGIESNTLKTRMDFKN